MPNGATRNPSRSPSHRTVASHCLREGRHCLAEASASAAAAGGVDLMRAFENVPTDLLYSCAVRDERLSISVPSPYERGPWRLGV